MVDNEPKGSPVVFEDSEWHITLQPNRSAVIKFKVPGTIVRALTFNYGDARDFLETFHEQVARCSPGCAIAALAGHLGYPECLFFEWAAAGEARREREAAQVIA